MSIIFAVLLFSLLVFVHELGHFVAAKLSGVQVNEFSIFMGPALVKWQRGETLYAIRCIPFGGYCAMEGEDGESENPRAFGAAKWWKRLIILVAGAAVNFVVGVLLMFIVYTPVDTVVVPVISGFQGFSTVDGENGLQTGDRILEMDGETIYVQEDFSTILTINNRQTHDLLVERNGEKVFLDDLVMEKHETTDEQGNKVMLYGINFSYEQLDLAGKLKYAWMQSVDTVRMIRLSLQMLFSGQAGISDMTGPVGIVSIMSDVAASADGWKVALTRMLYFGGFLGINLAVMNLLPIPALDGGRVVALLITTAVEAVTKKKINPKYEAYLHGAGMILLLALMAIITFKDIWGLF